MPGTVVKPLVDEQRGQVGLEADGSPHGLRLGTVRLGLPAIVHGQAAPHQVEGCDATQGHAQSIHTMQAAPGDGSSCLWLAITP